MLNIDDYIIYIIDLHPVLQLFFLVVFVFFFQWNLVSSQESTHLELVYLEHGFSHFPFKLLLPLAQMSDIYICRVECIKILNYYVYLDKKKSIVSATINPDITNIKNVAIIIYYKL